MSASDKKKLRKQQAAAFLTEKQQKERAEAKKLKVYTITFVTAMVLVVGITLGVLGVRAVNHSGILQKNTIAATVGDKELNSVELSYYYHDAIQQFYSQWYSQYSTSTDTYLKLMGLDTSKGLITQIYDQETGKTWAQYFIDTAVANAKSDLALYELAMKENFKLPEEEQTALDNSIKSMDIYAQLYGYKNANQYLRAVYGYGSDIDSYGEYSVRSAIASAYYDAHEDALKYDDAALREYEKDKLSNYNSYTYSTVYLSYTVFREGGTKDDKGNVTYSDAENEAARAAMKTAAELLATATSVEDLKEKIKTIKVSEGSELIVNENKAVLYTSIDSALKDWLTAKDRKDGDITAIPNTSTTKGEDGKDVTITNGYYVVVFHSMTDNAEKMSNVRHLLVKFKGGTTDKDSGDTVYSDAEKAEAKTKAEGFLKTWKEGDATEDTFIELAKKNSDDSSASQGGLFEDIHPDSNYVPSFLEWSISSDRKAGDAEVIESPYGYHVMYYVGDDEVTYRDYMITNEMRAADQKKWYDGILEPIKTSVGDTSKMGLDVIISG